jgi:hypothetical protein
MPVLKATALKPIINLKTVKALGLTVRRRCSRVSTGW